MRIVKDWFVSKNFTASQKSAIEYTYGFVTVDDAKIERETEKAVLLKWITDFGTVKNWIPKSCFEEVA